MKVQTKTQTLRKGYVLENAAAQAGCSSIYVSADSNNGIVWLKDFTGFQNLWAFAEDGDDFRDAVRGFASEEQSQFVVVFPLEYYHTLKSDNDEFRLMTVSSMLNRYGYNSFGSGYYKFWSVTYTEDPKLICDSEVEVTESILRIGKEGQESFWICVNQSLYEELTKKSFEKFNSLAAKGGLISGSVTSSSGTIRCTNAKIATDFLHASSNEEALTNVDKAVKAGAEEIVLFCEPEVFSELIAGLDSSFSFFGPSGMERIYDLVSHAGIYDCELSSNRRTGAIVIGLKALYPGTEICLAVNGGREKDLSPRLKETLEAARALVKQCKTSDPLKTARIIHDALCEQITYCSDEDNKEKDTAVGALLDGRADCDGYSDAFYLVGTLAGLNVRLQHGDSSAPSYTLLGGGATHMWNLLQLGGTWRMVDVTWDDDQDGAVHTWFNIGLDRASRTHDWNEDMTVPLLEQTDLKTRPENEFSVKSQADLQTALKAAVSSGDTCIVLVFDNENYQEYQDARSILRELGADQYNQYWNSGMRADDPL